MDRYDMIQKIGPVYHTPNIEGGEFSYVSAAGSRVKLENKVGCKVEHYKLDIRFEDKKSKVVVLVETKQHFVDADVEQLAEYVREEKAIFPRNRIISILANTTDNKIRVWKGTVDDEHFLKGESVMDSMEHYASLFEYSRQNDRVRVLSNTYMLNELLHKKDIPEKLRSQFVGTALLYIKDMVKKTGASIIDINLQKQLDQVWAMMDASAIRGAIEGTLNMLLDGSSNKAKKIQLLQKKVLNNQKVKALKTKDWREIFDFILMRIFAYINTNSAEGQDILNMFFIAFNKYTGKADKNQAFTPDHITDFMCRITGVNREKRVLDATCGSGSFLVQAMVKELADCRRGTTEKEAKALMEKVKKEHIYGIEIEENVFGLATTNMLIHSDGNSNVICENMFDDGKVLSFIKNAHPDIILMNPPYNAKPITISSRYKVDWSAKERDGKQDPTKGFVFVKRLADIACAENWKGTKMAVLLPMAAAIGNGTTLENMKCQLLEKNTLDAVFSLPPEIFYPGASAQACCMVFTLNQPHFGPDGKPDRETFFGYYKDDGFKKKKNLGRVEQFDAENHSIWKRTEAKWIDMYKNKKVIPGLSAMHAVTGKDEWLCEAYMETDYSKLTEADFQQTINDYLAYLIKDGRVYEA